MSADDAVRVTAEFLAKWDGVLTAYKDPSPDFEDLRISYECAAEALVAAIMPKFAKQAG